VKFTTTQTNTLRMMKEIFDSAHAVTLAHAKKRSVPLVATTQLAQTLDQLWASLAARQRCPRRFSEFDRGTELLLRSFTALLYNNEARVVDIERRVLRQMHKRAAEYELMAQMPRVKREYKRKPKQSAVEARASAVDEKVRDWERKLRYAKTKLAAYRKKQKYYAKKGAAV
jgi:ATP-dependent Lon protease